MTSRKSVRRGYILLVKLTVATSARVFLGFSVSKSECRDGCQDSKLLLHAYHVALLT
jgi:hypothetical protein